MRCDSRMRVSTPAAGSRDGAAAASAPAQRRSPVGVVERGRRRGAQRAVGALLQETGEYSWGSEG